MNTEAFAVVFTRLYAYFEKHKVVGLLLLFGFVASFLYLSTRLQFEEDITKLIPNTEASDMTNKVLKEVNFSDKIIFLIEKKPTASVDELTAYAQQFVDSLEANCSEYIAAVQGQVGDDAMLETFDFVYQNLPLFLDAEDYEAIDRRLAPDSIAQRSADNYQTLISPMGIVARNTILKDPLGLSFLGLQKLQELKVGDNFKLHNGFLITKDEAHLLLFISPQLAANETDGNAVFVRKLYAIAAQLNSNFESKISGEYYGTTMIAVANAQQIKHDIQFSISIAMSILMLLLIFFYRKLALPLILFLPTVLGALFAIGFLYLLKGQTSAVSLGIGSVLLGITLDYSLHILTHYRSNADVKQLYKDVSSPILTSSLTTAIAFLCLLFLHSEALQDLGIFAATSVFSAAVFALLLIPHLYKTKEQQKPKNTFIDRFAAIYFDNKKAIVSLVFVLLLASVFYYPKVIFNQDLAQLSYQTEQMRQTEQKLDQLMNTSSKSVYLVAHGHNIEAALKQNEQILNELAALKQKGDILSFNSSASFLQSQEKQAEKIAQWNRFWTQQKKENTKNELLEQGDNLGLKAKTFKPFYALLEQDFEPISLDEYTGINAELIAEFITQKEDLSTAVSMVKLAQEQLGPLVQQFSDMPNTVVIDRQHLNETFLGGLKNDFNRLATYSFIAVFFILLLFFRRIELALITIIPIALTALLTLGLMGFWGLEFNIFNIIISSFIFGMGVDYSIFMTTGLMKEYKYGKGHLPTYRTSILLSVITTILGIGALVFAKHPALTSISLVSIIGILSAVGISFVVQPLLFKFWITNKTKKGLAPMQFRTSVHGFILFAYYGLGGMLLSLFSVTILPLIPIAKKKKMKWFHRLLSTTVTSVLYGNPFVKKEILNPHKDPIIEPAIIISNHASAIDTLVIGSVTSNAIYLVNDWVYKSPVFGLIARVLGFYPVSNKIDNSVDHLQKKIDQGYSLVVFPEGKRSLNNKIGRFHKGAFFLQEQLGLDILPLYLHGNSEVLPKGDRVIYDGSLITKVGKRIALSDQSFGTTVNERKKKITAHYRAEFQKLRDQVEDADYFKGILFSNYIYKGNALYQSVKADFEERKHLYKRCSDELPMKAKIAHITDDMGQLDILLVSCSADRKIKSFVPSEDNRSIAKHCYTARHRKVVYVDQLADLYKEKTEILLISTKAININQHLLNQIPGLEQIVIINNALLAKQLSGIDIAIKHLEYEIKRRI